MITGDTDLGTHTPITGTIHNLQSLPTAPGSVDLKWDFHGTNASTIVLYSNGLPTLRAPSDTNTATVSGLANGIHTFSTQTIAPWQSHATGLIDVLGQRVKLNWTPASDDVKSYNIYANDELIATLSDTVLIPLIEATSVSQGRVSIIGNSNAIGDIDVVITDVGKCTINSVEHGFLKGTTIITSNGVSVLFHDEPSVYSTDDVYTAKVSIETQYITNELIPDTYVFAITACDEAGNESDPIETNPIRIIEVPKPVSNVIVTDELITYTLPAGVDEVRMYSNYNIHTKKLMPFIITDQAPQAIDDTGEIEINVEDEGEFKFYLRTVKSGIERPDITLYSIVLPVEIPTNITAPFNVTVKPLAGGKWQVSFDYLYSDDTQFDGFNIYASLGDIDYDDDFVTTLDTDVYSGFPVMRFNYSHNDAGSGELNIAVRTTYNGVEEQNTNFITITLDDTPPVFDGVVTGGAV